MRLHFAARDERGAWPVFGDALRVATIVALPRGFRAYVHRGRDRDYIEPLAQTLVAARGLIIEWLRP